MAYLLESTHTQTAIVSISGCGCRRKSPGWSTGSEKTTFNYEKIVEWTRVLCRCSLAMRQTDNTVSGMDGYKFYM